jgi:hypothetical protein
LTEEERLAFINKIMYGYYNYALKNNDNYPFKKQSFIDYKYCINIFYDICYYNHIILKNNNKNKQVFLNLYKKYNWDILVLEKDYSQFFKNVNISDYIIFI